MKEGGERQKAIQAVLSQIEKSHGKGSVVQMTAQYLVPVEGIPTGALSLDLALGGRGLPRGRIVEMFGPEGSGKSTLALSVIAQAQKQGGYAAYIDAEHAFDPEYAQKIGVRLDGLRFTLSQPSYGEEGLDICEQFIKSKAVDVVVVDSVAALVPKAEIEGEVGDQFMGLQARMMSQALRRLTGMTSKSNAIVIFINQLREKIGVMFGNPETTPGGRALKFYSSVRLDVRRIGQLKQGEEIVGNRTKVTVVKNKVAPPFRRAEFDILFGKGISLEGDVLDLGLQHGTIVKSGSWFSYVHPQQGEIRIGQGREMARQFLVDNPDFQAEVVAAVKAKALAAKAAPEEPDGSGDEDEELDVGAALVAEGRGRRKA
ncbi:MAG: recombinase RecA [Planctomycetota bacterium]|nr:MAG: recombinase RecA [Planctomycetota bacterium]